MSIWIKHIVCIYCLLAFHLKAEETIIFVFFLILFAEFKMLSFLCSLFLYVLVKVVHIF